ncbi:MAG: hypothetical protein QM718_13740 [Steroidobacteraceae bacterium]
MPIYRCAACGFIGEDTTRAAGGQLPCAKCGTANTLFAAPFYVQKLVERYMATRRELETLKLAAANPEEESASANDNLPASGMPGLDELNNTALLATEAQHQPLRDWFKARQIEAMFTYDAVDTTGYFDEAAREIGEHHGTLDGLMEQIRYAYRREFSWLNVDLARRDPQDRERILAFCRQLYSHTLFSRYSFKKQTQMLGLGIQPAPVVRNFFQGTWLEWYALGTLLQMCVAKKRDFSCARNAILTLQNSEARELDVAVLLKGRTLVVVECKTGEFRAELAKYTKLRQRLGLDRTQFIICNPELPDDQLAGLGKMYELTFVNLGALRPHLEIMI